MLKKIAHKWDKSADMKPTCNSQRIGKNCTEKK